MKQIVATASREILLLRRGLVFVEESDGAPGEQYLQAVEVKLAELGYALSTRAHDRLGRLSLPELTELQEWMCRVLSAALGADRNHEPLFRNFPDDVPNDTFDLWVRKVLAHFFQGENQPCLFCGKTGTTHVLNPCHHVVCNHCFDGSNYSACPVCEHHVDRSSPFFQPTRSQRQAVSSTNVPFKRIDLGGDPDTEARTLFVSFCARTQAMSPADRDAFAALLGDYRERVLPWIPETIPVKENIATVFGTLFRLCPPGIIWPAAKDRMKTATDVLRFIAAYSGADPALQGQNVVKPGMLVKTADGWRGKLTAPLETPPPGSRAIGIPVHVNRFKVSRLPRPLRRTFLQLLESLRSAALTEDMLRHRSYWVWLGEFLHPHEYAKRFPKVAAAFAIVRKTGPDGTKAPPFQTYYGRLDAAATRGDGAGFTDVLIERPGEFARRFDQALRLCSEDSAAMERLLAAFARSSPAFSTPVLLTLQSFLPTRAAKAPVRIFWPKGQIAKAVSSPDTRSPLPPDVIRRAVEIVRDELLRRFAEWPPLGDCIIDGALRGIMAPFNERTASRSAVSLPRGSRITVARSKIARLFLHWCQPETGGFASDLDLSVGFYDAQWNYIGVCSYYELKLQTSAGALIAVSAGDLRDAPYPDGATEFIDIHQDAALAQGVRYAVMVVTNYAGMPFSHLERGFAGVMLSETPGGKHFDPRTVELKFSIQGEQGVFLPLVFDLQDRLLHWLDVYSKGMFAFNNVATSNAAITKICPEMIAYFRSGIRMSMYDLVCLHAAARARRVFIRGPENALFVRQPGEGSNSFHERIKAGAADQTGTPLPPTFDQPTLATLNKGDLDLPDNSTVYALFPEKAHSTIAASDLIGK